MPSKRFRSFNYTPAKISIHHTEKASNLHQISPGYSPKCLVQLFTNGQPVELITLIPLILRDYIVCRGIAKGHRNT